MGGFLSYFSFRGRANRARYWMTNLALLGVIVVSIIPIGMASALLLGAMIVWLGVLAVSLANGARRLHDRNKSAWWLLLFQGLPLVCSGLRALATVGGDPASEPVGALFTLLGLPFSIWAFVELGCLKGTTGPNRFGDDPLGSPTEEVFA
jgi:uncharacterized membrane protein YhaH (DUF805 family)